MTTLYRSLIFVPGNNQRFLEKAKSLPADIVCFDLEDSVPDNEKKNARSLIKDILKNRKQFSAEVFVRTNSPDSGKVDDDLEEVLQIGLDGIVIPKVNNAMNLQIHMDAQIIIVQSIKIMKKGGKRWQQILNMRGEKKQKAPEAKKQREGNTNEHTGSN